jgi:hypothetical protein
MPQVRAQRSLETQLLTLLKQACSDGKFKVADHLLEALRCLAEETDAHPQGGPSCLDQGYLVIAEAFRPKSLAKTCGRSGPHKKRMH